MKQSLIHEAVTTIERKDYREASIRSKQSLDGIKEVTISKAVGMASQLALSVRTSQRIMEKRRIAHNGVI